MSDRDLDGMIQFLIGKGIGDSLADVFYNSTAVVCKMFDDGMLEVKSGNVLIKSIPTISKILGVDND